MVHRNSSDIPHSTWTKAEMGSLIDEYIRKQKTSLFHRIVAVLAIALAASPTLYNELGPVAGYVTAKNRLEPLSASEHLAHKKEWLRCAQVVAMHSKDPQALSVSDFLKETLTAALINYETPGTPVVVQVEFGRRYGLRVLFADVESALHRQQDNSFSMEKDFLFLKYYPNRQAILINHDKPLQSSLRGLFLLREGYRAYRYATLKSGVSHEEIILDTVSFEYRLMAALYGKPYTAMVQHLAERYQFNHDQPPVLELNVQGDLRKIYQDRLQTLFDEVLTQEELYAVFLELVIQAARLAGQKFYPQDTRRQAIVLRGFYNDIYSKAF